MIAPRFKLFGAHSKKVRTEISLNSSQWPESLGPRVSRAGPSELNRAVQASSGVCDNKLRRKSN